MPLSFPGNPTLYQSHFTGGRTWLYNGSGWITDVAPVANLQAITTNIVPGANVTYDIGSSSRRWRDLYLSGNTIDLGGTAIKSTANGVSFTNAANERQYHFQLAAFSWSVLVTLLPYVLVQLD